MYPLKTVIRILAIISILIAIGFYLNITDKETNSDVLVEDGNNQATENDNIKKNSTDTVESLPVPKVGLATLIGKSSSTLEQKYGKPDRIDASSYDYNWWIYNNQEKGYFQAGVYQNKVVTVFAIGDAVNIAPYKIGQEVGDIFASTPIETNISFRYDNSSYRFELSEDEVNNRPLIRIGHFYAQLYFDKFTGTLSSIRYMDAKTLLQLRPFELVYRGELVETASSKKSDSEAVEKGNEKQILDITNVIRKRFHLASVSWDRETAKVALGHSIDMFETKSFSHTSKKYGDLTQRLKKGDIVYKAAGENIAAGYLDAAAVMEGWLNSKGHRECLLNKEFTHLGVGVYQKYYTQNFIEKW
ncbi:CAP domain-containing protein [Niallia nealsonii]|uniref:CAP domain-containing protein n=1 Tax=Niallia nealsonii TaxID=115979 RepID=UPI001F19562C|nr:CAP domain-containing protein [Niallia nealsonii]